MLRREDAADATAETLNDTLMALRDIAKKHGLRFTSMAILAKHAADVMADVLDIASRDTTRRPIKKET